MDIKIKLLNSDAKIPSKGSPCSAGFDLYANVTDKVIVNPGQTCKIGTGIALEIPENYFGAIFARSGLATKEGLRPANCVGVVDSDYRGEIIVAIHNDSDVQRTIENNERIAQISFIPFLNASFISVDHLEESTRGSDGFGSTGV